MALCLLFGISPNTLMEYEQRLAETVESYNL